MMAIVQHAYGSADVLRLAGIEQPTPGLHDVLVRVHAASVNRAGWLVTTGRPAVMRTAVGPRRPHVAPCRACATPAGCSPATRC
jgi:NADPH:quinone reductase-like Zn-dependent oxidoreductase